MNNVELKEEKIIYNDNELFYKINPNTQSINTLTITFNKYLHSKTNELKPGEVSITFKNENDIPRLIGLFLQEISKQKRIDPNIKIVFVVITNNREQEEKIAREVANIIGLNYEFVYKQELIKAVIGLSKEEMSKQQQLQNEILQSQQNYQQQNLIAHGTTQIIKDDINGNSKKYIEIDDKIYEDNDTLSIAEKKQNLLQSWLQDPLKSTEIASLSKERLDEELTASVTMDQKTHYLNSASSLTSDDKLANMSNNIASEHDGKVNEELGIIENSANMENEYTVVEETRTNGFNVVSPTTTEQTIKGNKTSSSISGNTSGESTYNTSFEEDTNERKVENIYYVDDYLNELYNFKGEIIGTLGQQSGYYIDENNNLVKDGQVIGPVENLRDMKQTETKSNVRKRVLEKPNGYVSFMLIAICLSLMLLIYIIFTLI